MNANYTRLVINSSQKNIEKITIVDFKSWNLPSNSPF